MGAEQSSTEIANLALSHCGLSKPVANLTTDKSIEAQMVNKWWATARRTVLKKIPWSFATKQVAPALVASQPTPEWLYAYVYPQDCLKITRFVSWRLNNDTRQSRVPYRVMQPVSVLLSTLQTPPTSYSQTTGLWIYTNWPGTNVSLQTIIEYTFDNDNVSQWPDDFNAAFSLMLAALVAPSLTSGNTQQLKAGLDQQFKTAIDMAGADNLNEEQRPQDPASEFIRGRGGDAGYGYPGGQWVAEPPGFFVE